MFRTIRVLVSALALALVLTVAADRVTAQGCAPPPAVVTYYPPPAVSYYAPPTVAYYPPAPVVAYYPPPTVAYYAPPTVAYAPPAYPAATTTTRYGLFGRPRWSTTTYYAP